ncbi:MAG TPA: hypothetical protein VI796_03205, partial [Candidatus Thermoplasmatota archaeon]|nr:hypothetical protein [Candidatus Thermoplasmatota archaeon]
MVETPAPARILLVALALAMVVGVSGCFGGGSDKEEEPTYGPDGSPLPPLEVDVEEPEPDVVKAFEDYQRAIFSRDGEGVRVMQSSMVSARPIRSESQAYAEWGSNDVLRVDISSDSVGPLSGILFCASDRVVLIRPEASVEARPPGDPDHNCAVLLFPVEPQALFGVDDLARMERDPPVIREDGNVDLAYRDATQSVNVTLDRQGRLLWTEFRNADTVFQVALDYGERQPLYVPDGDARLPARVKYDERYDVLSGQVVWAVQESLQVPPLS